MGVIYVARSANLGKWGADVGLGKHIFKVGCCDEAPEDLAKAGWAGESDWTIVKKADAGDVTEAEILERLGRKVKVVDPHFYPKIKGAVGIFKVKPADVENHVLLTLALANNSVDKVKIKPADYATYLINNALR